MCVSARRARILDQCHKCLNFAMCVCMCVCVCVPCVRACVSFFHIILYVNCYGRTVLYVCTKYSVQVNTYHVSAQCVEERIINVHCYGATRSPGPGEASGTVPETESEGSRLGSPPGRQ